jgi:hypothetical protein
LKSELKYKLESLPERCEICHQADAFNQQTGYCSRCAQVLESLEKVSQINTTYSSKTSYNADNVTFKIYFASMVVGAFTVVALNFLLFGGISLLSRLANHGPIPKYYLLIIGTVWIGNFAVGNYAAFQYFFNHTNSIINKGSAFIVSIITVGAANFSQVLFLLIKGQFKYDPFHAGDWAFARFIILIPIWVPLAGMLGLVTRYCYWLCNRSKLTK